MHDVRCKRNRFNTLLFRLDWKGIYVYCRDCRREGDKRGDEHFFSWVELLALLMESNDKHG